jgi:hypothetical protein
VLKSIHTLTIREYSLFEKTGEVKYLLEECKYCYGKGFINNKECKKCNGTGRVVTKKPLNTSLLLQEISIGLNGENENTAQLQKENHKLKSQYRIQLLITLYDACYNLMVLQTELNEWKILIGDKPTDLKNLKKYTDEIKRVTNIEIETIEDLLKLKKEIERWTDKYAENFPKSDIEKEGLTFMQIVLGVFAATNMSLDYQMYLSDFFILKKDAEELNKRMKQSQEKVNG